MERDRGEGGRYQVTVEDHFAAAHALRGYDGDCERLHGHNWTVRVTVESRVLNEQGLAMDFRELKKLLHAVITPYDHAELSVIPPFDRINPSSENLARQVFDSLKAHFIRGSCRLVKVEVSETPQSTASYQE